MAKFKVVSDGSRFGTKVYAPDGTDISGHIHSVEFRQSAGDLLSVQLEVINPIVDVVGEAEGLDYIAGHLVKEVDETSLANEIRQTRLKKVSVGG